MAKRAAIPAKRVVKASKASPKQAAQPKDPGTNGPITADFETFHIHVGIIRRQQDKVAAERKFLKDARRKASDAGINLGDLDRAMLMSEWEPETVQESIRRQATYAYWMGLAPNVQADLFQAADNRVTEEKRAYDEGYVEGLEGKTAAGDRYDAGNPMGQARLSGHADGQKVLMSRIGQLQKPEETKPEEPAAEQEPAPEAGVEAEQGAPADATVQ